MSIGASSHDGSSATALPVQVSSAGIATEVVLNAPLPAKTRAWVDPVRHGSTNSGFVPPLPQVNASSDRRRAGCRPGRGCRGRVDPVGLADHQTAVTRIGPREQPPHGCDRRPVGVAVVV